jgi:Tol biopolymer transport system component
MKPLFVAGAVFLCSGAAGLLALDSRAQTVSVPQTTLVDLPGVGVVDAVMSANGKFIYYGNNKSLMVYDRARKQSTEVAPRDAGYLTISLRGDLLAFAAPDEAGNQLHVYAIALDPASGRATGVPRRVTVEPGDTPAISPDGKWIAFAGYDSPDRRKQRLAVMPSDGGPERVLARHDLSIEPIRWTPDGKWIYYGAGRDSVQLNYRVALSGGAPILFVKSQDTYPGLSPDGRLFVANGTRSQNYVYDSDGRKLGEYPSSDDRYAYSWSAPNRILAIVGSRPTMLFSRSLAKGETRTIAVPPGRVWEPRWSPDGKQIAMIQFSESGDTSWILVMNPDGSGVRRTQVPLRPGVMGVGVSWSPDSRWVAYLGPRPIGNGDPQWWTSVGAVEISTGRLVPYPAAKTGRPSWSSDSRSFLLPVLADTTPAAGGRFRVEVHRFSLSGSNRVIGEFRADGPGWSALSDSTAMRTPAPGAEARIEAIGGGASIATFPAGPRYSFPTLSADQRWMMFRSGDLKAFHTVHLARTDGSEITTIPLSFSPVGGLGNPAFLPGNRSAILAGTTDSPDSVAYYRVDFTTRAVTRLVAVARPARFGPQFTVSPDGSTLLYATLAPPASSIVELDLSGFAKRAP